MILEEKKLNTLFNFFPSHKVRLQKGFTSALFPPKTSFTKGNFLLHKCTIIIMISTTSYIDLTSLWFILVSRQTHSPVGIVRNH